MERKSVIIAVSMQANEVLGRIQVKVNKDFLGGKITKRDLASWVIENGETQLSDRSIVDIHKRYRNDLALAQNIHRRIKAAGKSGMTKLELNQLLYDLFAANGFDLRGTIPNNISGRES